jgi:protein TonB
VPLPQLRKPEVVIPEPPRFEMIRVVERVEGPPGPPVVAAPPRPAAPPAPPAPPAPAPTKPAIDPPRFDLAYLDNPAPAYPVFAKRAREQGTVLLRVDVDARGKVTRIALEKSSGSDRLDSAALAAVKHWRFAPARAGDRAVAGVAIVPINFQLEG